MHSTVLFAGIAWLTILLGVCVVRLATVRTPAQRILALDMVVLVLIGLLALAAAEDQRAYPLDAALALALLSFVATLAAARYIGDRRPFG